MLRSLVVASDLTKASGRSGYGSGAVATGGSRCPCDVPRLCKQLRPDLKIYISPLNIDPVAPDLPISTPASYSADLANAIGPFYTQGIAEDTAALHQGIFNAGRSSTGRSAWWRTSSSHCCIASSRNF